MAYSKCNVNQPVVTLEHVLEEKGPRYLKITRLLLYVIAHRR